MTRPRNHRPIGTSSPQGTTQKLRKLSKPLKSSLETKQLQNKRAAYRKGLWGERVALLFLRLKGYSFLAHRFKTPFGEIDLLVRKGRMLIVVEVKARSTLSAGLEAISPRSQKRLTNALRFFLTQRPQYDCFDVRFDSIIVRPWRFPQHFSHVIS